MTIGREADAMAEPAGCPVALWARAGFRMQYGRGCRSGDCVQQMLHPPTAVNTHSAASNGLDRGRRIFQSMPNYVVPSSLASKTLSAA